jgi:hypothetical protein
MTTRAADRRIRRTASCVTDTRVVESDDPVNAEIDAENVMRKVVARKMEP